MEDNMKTTLVGSIAGLALFAVLNAASAETVKIFLPEQKKVCKDLKDRTDLALDSDLFGFTKGYLSAYAVNTGNDILRKTDMGAVNKWIYDRCQLFPEESLTNMIQKMADELAK
jgi:hypothetical protein